MSLLPKMNLINMTSDNILMYGILIIAQGANKNTKISGRTLSKQEVPISQGTTTYDKVGLLYVEVFFSIRKSIEYTFNHSCIFEITIFPIT